MSALREEDWVSHVALLAIGMTLHETAITGKMYFFYFSGTLTSITLKHYYYSLYAADAFTGGFYFNHPDIAGRYKTVAFGITNTFAQLTGFLNPFLVAKLTPDVSVLIALAC